MTGLSSTEVSTPLMAVTSLSFVATMRKAVSTSTGDGTVRPKATTTLPCSTRTVMPSQAYQDMIIGIESGNSTALVDTVNVEEPGTLRSLIADSVASKVTLLTVSGSINSSDMKFLRTLAGLDSVGTYSPAALRSLDLQHASIVEGGDPYLYNGNHECTTHSGEWPELAFYGARRLRRLVLPDKVTTFGTGALSGMLSLDSLLLPTALQQEYAIADNVVYSPDTTTVLAVLPHAGSTLSLHKGTKAHRCLRHGRHAWRTELDVAGVSRQHCQLRFCRSQRTGHSEVGGKACSRHRCKGVC